MDTVRYVLALVVWATVPPAVLYWYVIHPFAGYWRSVGPTRTYLVVIPLTLLMMGVLFRWREPVASSDLGENWPIFYSGLILWIGSFLMERRLRRELDFKTLAGVPELRPADPDEEPVLLDRGMYARMRHPRYVSVFVGTLGWSMMANYGAAYAVTASLIPLLLGLVHLEERELVDRFGDRYLRYRERVPALIPRWRGD